jgi:hypothetical protein
MTLSVKIGVFWRVTPRSLVAIRRSFGGTLCLLLKEETDFLNCKLGRHAFQFIGNSVFQTLITLSYSGGQVTREKLLCLDHELELHPNHCLTKSKMIILSHINFVNFFEPVKFWSSVCCTLYRLSYRHGS